MRHSPADDLGETAVVAAVEHVEHHLGVDHSPGPGHEGRFQHPHASVAAAQRMLRTPQHPPLRRGAGRAPRRHERKRIARRIDIEHPSATGEFPRQRSAEPFLLVAPRFRSGNYERLFSCHCSAMSLPAKDAFQQSCRRRSPSCGSALLPRFPQGGKRAPTLF